MVPFVGTLDMVKSNPRTHSGNLATLATHEMFRPKPVFGSVASCAILCHFPTAKLTVANVHFQSGKAAAEDRLAQLETVMKATNGKRVLVIGDTNTRVGELGSIAELGLITPDLPSPTWDGRRNQFRGGTRPFSAYFTRFFHTSDLEIETIEVLTEPFRAEGYQFHLSDHFPLVVNITN